jgi:FMN reductase
MTQRKPTIVTFTGGLWSPSKTKSVALAISTAIAERINGTERLVEASTLAEEIGTTLTRDSAPAALREALLAVENADVLVAASPVFRGTFGGHFKHFFDLVDPISLRGVPVVLAAAGGGDKHCLVVEYALRPLFGFFQAFSVPTGVYASERDFENGILTNAVVTARISDAATEVSTLLSRSQSSFREEAKAVAASVGARP